jgi:hypothetical protein
VYVTCQARVCNERAGKGLQGSLPTDDEEVRGGHVLQADGAGVKVVAFCGLAALHSPQSDT